MRRCILHVQNTHSDRLRNEDANSSSGDANCVRRGICISDVRVIADNDTRPDGSSTEHNVMSCAGESYLQSADLANANYCRKFGRLIEAAVVVLDSCVCTRIQTSSWLEIGTQFLQTHANELLTSVACIAWKTAIFDKQICR